MDIKPLVEGLHPLERKVVPFLNKVKTLSELVEKSGLQEVEAMRALQWLSNKDVLKIISTEDEFAELDVNGKRYSEIGLPEKRFLMEIKNDSKSVDEMMRKLGKDEFAISVGILKAKNAVEMKAGRIQINDTGKKLLLKESIEELLLKRLSGGPVETGDFENDERTAFDNLMKKKADSAEEDTEDKDDRTY